MTLALAASLVFVVAGAVLLVIGGTVATAIAMALLGFAGVIWVSMAFFAVGRSEDREREAAASAAAVPPPPVEKEHGKGPVHKEERPDHRFRRRP
jgi:hypothetical protein